MLKRADTILQDVCLLDPGRPIVVGVSGGPDSLCLLDILNNSGYSLIVAHLDHGMRPESSIEAEEVRNIVERLGYKLVLAKMDVKAFAGSQKLSQEEAARILRYRFLFQQAKLKDAQAVTVGHTADDQVETVLMHLLRGAGLSGLKGMSYRSLPNEWSQEIALVRPLLGFWRDEIMDYVAERNYQPIFDASNLDTQFFRNRLRHDLIPYLENYNPQLRQLIWRTAEILQEDYNIVDSNITSAWQRCILDENERYIAIDPQCLKQQPIGVQRYLLRRAIFKLRPGIRDVDFNTINRAVKFLHSPSNNSQLDLTAGLRLLLEEDKLWLTSWETALPNRDWPQLDPGSELRLHIPGKVTLANGWQLIAKNISNTKFQKRRATTNDDPYQVWIDFERLRQPIQIRTRQPGDRFQPLGLKGHSKKISDLMINLKIPHRARDGWPLLYSDDQIVWVPGIQLAYPYRIKDKTINITHLTLKRG
jgi:tRNA(Ile)-lysidine synthase